MAAPLTLQLNIEDGHAEEQGPFARVVPLPNGDGDCLLMVAHAQGPGAAEVCQNALDYLVTAFTHGRLSISRRLLDGLRGIHHGLAADNQRSLPEHRVTLGAVLALTRGEDIYLTQAGDARAYLIDTEGRHNLTPPSGDGEEALGGARAPQLVVRRLRLEPGQRMVLLAGGHAASGCSAHLAHAFQTGLEDGMAAVYRQEHAARSFGALALQLAGEAAAGSARPVRYGAVRVPRPDPPVSPYAGFDEPAPLVDSPARTVTVGLRPAPLRAPNPLAGLIPPRLVAGAAVLFIAAGIFMGARSALDQWGQQSQQQALSALQEAAELERKAGEAPNPSQRRELLAQAASQLEALVQRDPNRAGAQDALGRLRQALTNLDAIVKLPDLRVVADFSQDPGGSVLTRDLAATPAGLLVLDKGGDRVLQVSAAPQQGDGQQRAVATLAQSASRGRRNFSNLVWLPRAPGWPRDSVLALDESRALLELAAGADPRPLALRGAAEWESVQTVQGYNGVLYVLDPKASQVWRYAPAGDGFDSERRPALPSLDLRDGVDMAIDGDFYVLLKTGKVLKVTGGRAVPFNQDGIDRPLLSPGALATAPGLPTLYVADQGNRRVVELDKATGKFLRQFPLDNLPAVHDLWVDQQSGLLYLLTDRQLYAASLPKG